LCRAATGRPHVDDADVRAARGQLFGDRGADDAGADDDDPHPISLSA
jgi:hypothetical protein